MQVGREESLAATVLAKMAVERAKEMSSKAHLFGLKFPQPDQEHNKFVTEVLVGMLMQKPVIEKKDRLLFNKMSEDSGLYKKMLKINSPDLGTCQFDEVKWTTAEGQLAQLLHYGMLYKPLLYTYNEGDRFLIGGEEGEFANDTLAMAWDNFKANSCIFLPGCWKVESIHRTSPRVHAEPRSYVTYADGYIPYWRFTPRRKMFNVVKAAKADKTMKWKEFNFCVYAPAKSLYFPTFIES